MKITGEGLEPPQGHNSTSMAFSDRKARRGEGSKDKNIGRKFWPEFSFGPSRIEGGLGRKCL